MSSDNEALDVWLKFGTCPKDEFHGPDCECDDAAEYEANTFRCHGGGVTVKWYHTAVGLVRSKWFDNYSAACDWLESEGFQDFSS